MCVLVEVHTAAEEFIPTSRSFVLKQLMISRAPDDNCVHVGTGMSKPWLKVQVDRDKA